ncbi:outer membrane beta-barrel family protein [Larkinella soli]|uniref:outer membrane beta-barrel family protein n=1 Tax=Larkinella soli TaxID=1770527 RepID=UPI000FFCA09A|nr:outer membrane beta-barrel family protein [Larkinella soli]
MLPHLAFPQSLLRGVVLDSVSQKPLMEATVSLLSARDSALVEYIITDGEGGYFFKNVAEGRYRVLVTYVGYRNGALALTIPKGKQTVVADTIRMNPRSIDLNEVIVKQEAPPITVKQDTVEFNAGSFKTRPNAQVEEMLKKLPGVEVDRDGTIKAQGQEVKKVLVDGKPFFGDDPKMATRNLPADIIDKIQLYDQQNDQSQFSGIDDGNREKTINLTTKKDKRKGTFGQQSIGIGSNENDRNQPRYAARVNLNRFNGNRQFSLITQANNINQQGFTNQSLFGGGAGLGAGFGGGGQVVIDGGRGSSRGGGNSGGNNNAITRTLAGGLNYHDEIGKKVDLTASYFLNNLNTLTEQQSRRQYALPDTSYLTDQDSRSRNETMSHRFNMRLNYQLDSLTTLRIVPSFTVQNSAYNSTNFSQTFADDRSLLNTSRTAYRSNGDGISGNNNLLLMRKFRRKGRTLSLNWNTAVNNQDTEGFIESANEFFGSAGGSRSQNFRQRSEQESRSVTHTVNLAYTEPLSLTKSLEFHYNIQANRNRSNRTVADFNEQTGQFDRFNPALSNEFLNNFSTNRAGSTFQNKRLKFTYALGLDLQVANLRSDNRSRDSVLNRQFTNLLPNALFTYTFARNRSLRINYRSRINAPSVSQLQPVPDNTNPLNIRIGNPNLKPEYIHAVSLMYNTFQQTTFRSFFAALNASRTDNRIVSATTFDNRGAQTTRPVNTDGNYSLNGFMGIGRRIRPLKANLNFNTNVAYNRNNSFVNRQLNRSDNWTVGQGVGLSSNFNEKLEFSVGGNVNYQTARYSLQSSQNTEFFNKSLTADVYYQLPFRFFVTSDMVWNNYSGKSAGAVQNFALWNAAIARQLFKNRQGELRLQVYDLLNQNRSINRNVTEIYTEEIRSRVLNRYFMISFTYNLRRFGSPAGRRNGAPEDRDRFFDQPGLPRPRIGG